MADQCLALLADPARRQALGTAGRSQVAARFDWRRIEEQLDGVMALATRHATPAV
jgi:glycosyltransferase involved in cell wall biosynthesis